MPTILAATLDQLLTTFAHNWPFLVAGAVVAAGLKVYTKPQAIARFFRAHGASSVVLATLLAVATPLCSCGTMAVILGMMASSVPWAPIVAFMAASPITSPEETVISAGLFGWPFALTLLGVSAIIGLGAGAAAHMLERRGWLAGQARRLPVVDARQPESARASCCAVSTSAPVAIAAPLRIGGFAEGGAAAVCCAPSSIAVELGPPLRQRLADWSRAARLPQLRDEVLRGGVRLLVLFGGFAFVGYLLNNLIPTTWVAALFGRGSRLGVPLAALVGLPLYLNSDASLPMVRAFVDNGAGAGAALAFIVTGAGTSLGAVTGALTIARWRVIGIVLAALLAGAILAGYGYDLAATMAASR